HLTDGEGLADPATLPPDHDALEDLDARARAFDDSHVHLEGVPRPEVWYVRSQRLTVERVQGVHQVVLQYLGQPGRCAGLTRRSWYRRTHRPAAGQPYDGATTSAANENGLAVERPRAGPGGGRGSVPSSVRAAIGLSRRDCPRAAPT